MFIHGDELNADDAEPHPVVDTLENHRQKRQNFACLHSMHVPRYSCGWSDYTIKAPRRERPLIRKSAALGDRDPVGW